MSVVSFQQQLHPVIQSEEEKEGSREEDSWGLAQNEDLVFTEQRDISWTVYYWENKTLKKCENDLMYPIIYKIWLNSFNLFLQFFF